MAAGCILIVFFIYIGLVYFLGLGFSIRFFFIYFFLGGGGFVGVGITSKLDYFCVIKANSHC